MEQEEGQWDYDLFWRLPLGHTKTSFDYCEFVLCQSDDEGRQTTKVGLQARDLDSLIDKAIELNYINLGMDCVKTLRYPYVAVDGADIPVGPEIIRYFVDKYKRKLDEIE